MTDNSNPNEPTAYRVLFQEWMVWEIVIDEAESAEDAIAQAKTRFIENGSDACRLRNNGTEDWQAEGCAR